MSEEFDWHKIDANDAIVLTRLNKLEKHIEALSKRLDMFGSDLGKLGLRVKNFEDEAKARRNDNYPQ